MIRAEIPRGIAQERRNRLQTGKGSSFPLSAQKRAVFGVEGPATQEFLSGSRPRMAEKRLKPTGPSPAICAARMAGVPGTGGAGRDRTQACLARERLSRFPTIESCIRCMDSRNPGQSTGSRRLNGRRGPGAAIQIGLWNVSCNITPRHSGALPAWIIAPTRKSEGKNRYSCDSSAFSVPGSLRPEAVSCVLWLLGASEGQFPP